MTNVALLESVMQHIKDHPESHNQSNWLSQNECGTAGCFAGWTCLLSGYEPHQNTWEKTLSRRDVTAMNSHVKVAGLAPALHVKEVAIELLDIDPGDASYLFSSVNTRAMLELMVKDLANDDEMRTLRAYAVEAHGEEWAEEHGYSADWEDYILDSDDNPPF